MAKIIETIVKVALVMVVLFFTKVEKFMAKSIIHAHIPTIVLGTTLTLVFGIYGFIFYISAFIVGVIYAISQGYTRESFSF